MVSGFDQRLDRILGAKTAQVLLKEFGYETARDLLEHYPRRYVTRGELTVISDLPVGETVTIVAEVRQVRTRRMAAKRGSILEVTISDGHGFLTLTFFNQPWREQNIRVGDRGIFSGKISAYRGQLQLAHPDYELFERSDLSESEAKAWSEEPVPVYAATAKLPSWKIAQSLSLVLDAVSNIPEFLPEELLRSRGIISQTDALRMIHQPARHADWKIARKTLRYTEAFLLQMELLKRKAELMATAGQPLNRIVDGFLDRFDALLPFQLTADQVTAGTEIEADLAKGYPMSRLLQGEVGSGKTLVALRSMLLAADNQKQAALLVPTEVLASQHFRSVTEMLGEELSEALQPTLLTGQMPAAARREALEKISAGQAKVIIGTHALFSSGVEFNNLALVVIDEQHRFGVEQRHALTLKGTHPHQLVMTATPIPRTVALTAFGDLETSTITTLPAGRPGISSFLVPLAQQPHWETRIWQRMAEELQQGRQAFVICPAIDPSDSKDSSTLSDVEAQHRASEEGVLELPDTEQLPLTIASVTETLEKLEAMPQLAQWRKAALHGRLSAEQKNETMDAFAAGTIQILVATTIIEVGVNVPNASIMVVLSAERFGISQLHQIRGRVGRGAVPGVALFVTEADDDSLAMQRLQAVTASHDGFELAAADLELRKEGDVLGETQSGARTSLKLLRVTKDHELILEAREDAAALLAADPELLASPALAQALAEVHDKERHFLTKS